MEGAFLCLVVFVGFGKNFFLYFLGGRVVWEVGFFVSGFWSGFWFVFVLFWGFFLVFIFAGWIFVVFLIVILVWVFGFGFFCSSDMVGGESYPCI